MPTVKINHMAARMALAVLAFNCWEGRAASAPVAGHEANPAAPAAAIVQPPLVGATPGAKDAYVNSELAKLFIGRPVQIRFRRVFSDWMIVDAFPVDAKPEANPWAGQPVYSLNFFSYGDAATAKSKIQEQLRSFPSPEAMTKAGFDEFYAVAKGGYLGRVGTLMLLLSSSSLERDDAIFSTLVKNLQANPGLMPRLIAYASKMHFADPAPLRTALPKISAKVPDLLFAKISDYDLPYEPNSVEAVYNGANGLGLHIIAKAYDAESSAVSALGQDEMGISVSPENSETVEGIGVLEYTRYGGMDFVIGPYTFNLRLFNYDQATSQALLKKVFSALHAELAPGTPVSSLPGKK